MLLRIIISRYIDIILLLLISVAILVTPFLNVPQLTDSQTTPKIFFITLITLTALISLTLKWLINKRVNFTISPLTLPLLIFLAAMYVSVFFSPTKIVDFLGTQPLLGNSLVFWGIFILFFIVLVNSIKTINFTKTIIYCLIFTSFLNSLLILNTYFKLLTFHFALLTSSLTFHFSLLTIPLLFYLTLTPPRYLPFYTPLILLTTNLLAITLTGSYLELLLTILSLLTLLTLSFLHQPPRGYLKYYLILVRQFLPALVIVTLVTAWHYFSHPQLLTANNLDLFVIRKSYFLNLNFTTIPSLLTLISALYLISRIIILGFQALNQTKDLLESTLGITLIFGLVAALVYPLSPVNLLTILTIAGLLTTGRRFVISTNLALCTLHFALCTLVSILGLFLGTRLLLADYHHQKGLSLASTDTTNAYFQIKQAIKLNRFSDLYWSNLATLAFYQAQSEAQIKNFSGVKSYLDEALDAARRGTQINPKSAQNWFNLGVLEAKISRTDANFISESTRDFQQAIDNDPTNPRLRLDIGEVYYQLGRFDKSSDYFSQAVAVAPNLANPHYNLSLSLQSEGKITEAIFSAEKTLSLLSPNSPDYRAADKLLQTLKSPTESSASANLNLPSTEALVVPKNSGRKLIINGNLQ